MMTEGEVAATGRLAVAALCSDAFLRAAERERQPLFAVKCGSVRLEIVVEWRGSEAVFLLRERTGRAGRDVATFYAIAEVEGPLAEAERRNVEPDTSAFGVARLFVKRAGARRVEAMLGGRR